MTFNRLPERDIDHLEYFTSTDVDGVLHCRAARKNILVSE